MLKKADIIALENHWALKDIDKKYLNKAEEDIKQLLIAKTLNSVLAIDAQEVDYDNLQRVGNIYETVAIDGMQDFITSNDNKRLFVAASFKAYQCYSLCPLGDNEFEKLFNVLHISALAYCGEHWNEIKGFYKDNNVDKLEIKQSKEWDTIVLYTLFNCWIKLFNKRNWDDLNSIVESIVKLRELQHEKESELFNDNAHISKKDDALKLISLYHTAKATELLATYATQGTPTNIKVQLDKHFESAINSAILSSDIELEILVRWLYCASLQMIEASVWWIARTINSRTTDFVKYATKNSGLFELLPPQKAAIREQGLLDSAKLSIAIEMPTSGGKTLLAEFKILQALNQFSAENGWVAYVAPTRALAAQITRRFRRDFQDSIVVEQLTAALNIDSFEEELLGGSEKRFDVLIATPEKLNLVIKNNKVKRPLALAVMDEAHNIEDEERGLRIELLLSTIKNECNNCNFLLLMPYVANANDIARWLSSDADSYKSISITGTEWKPSEKMIGLLNKEHGQEKGDWFVKFTPVITSKDTITTEPMQIGNIRPMKIPYSSASLTNIVEVAAQTLQTYGTCVVVVSKIKETWHTARGMQKLLPTIYKDDEKINLVQKYISDELGENFELIDMLSKGIAVHNSGLSDDLRTLIEWLAEEGKLKVLCSTTTIAQGINFPINSVVLQTINHPSPRGSKQMTPREFWNLAGRTGRIGQERIGVVGLASDNDDKDLLYKDYLLKATDNLISRISKMLEDVNVLAKQFNLTTLMYDDKWSDFRCFIAHLCNQKETLEAALADTEQLLRSTLGYTYLRSTKQGELKAMLLLETTKQYIGVLKKNNNSVLKLVDQTGFTPEGVKQALSSVNSLRLDKSDFESKTLFGNSGKLSSLYGIMLRIPQLSSLQDVAGDGLTNKKLANITNDWVSGASIQDIAKKYFNGIGTENVSKTYRAINRQIANYGTWGLSTITKLINIDFESLSQEEKDEINSLPAMIYHGVNTREAVLMRMNSIPRSIAQNVGNLYKKDKNSDYSIEGARMFIKNMSDPQWEEVVPVTSKLKGKGYKIIWNLISGEKPF